MSTIVESIAYQSEGCVVNKTSCSIYRLLAHVYFRLLACYMCMSGY